jgi:hypothetical protein
LFAGEDETLLVRRDSFFVLDFRFYVVDCVRRLDFKGDGFTRQGLDEDLHYGISIVQMSNDIDKRTKAGWIGMDWRLTCDATTSVCKCCRCSRLSGAVRL